MAYHLLVAVVLSLFYTCSFPYVRSVEEGFISVEISNKGLDFAKDLLIEKAVSSFVPLQIPQIEKSANIPVVGKVKMILSNITIYQLGVSSSIVKTGESGVVIAASGATANLTMNWQYSYNSWFISFTDKGVASVQVEGMEIGTTLGLKNQQGSIGVYALDYGCYVKNIHIELNDGASWLYQGLVDAFESRIASAVENAISEKIRYGITKLHSLLQSLPREVSLDHITALNASFVNDPVLSDSSIDLEIDGLFMTMHDIAVYKNDQLYLRTPVSCPDKMVGISLHETVLNSASLVYFNEGLMHWIIDKIPDQFLLNTAEWKYIIPQLYKLYPNDDMDLNISFSSPPIIKIENRNIDVRVDSDVTIDVRDANETIPVACVSVVIHASAFVEILTNKLAGIVKLEDITMNLKWSKIGRLRLHMVQLLMSTILRTVVLPYVNFRIMKGLPLPLIHGYTLQNSQIHCSHSRITLCGDIGMNNTLLPP